MTANQIYTPAGWRVLIDLMREQGVLQTSFYLSSSAYANPYFRPHHYTEWPLPVFNNDNMEKYS